MGKASRESSQKSVYRVGSRRVKRAKYYALTRKFKVDQIISLEIGRVKQVERRE